MSHRQQAHLRLVGEQRKQRARCGWSVERHLTEGVVADFREAMTAERRLWGEWLRKLAYDTREEGGKAGKEGNTAQAAICLKCASAFEMLARKIEAGETDGQVEFT